MPQTRSNVGFNILVHSVFLLALILEDDARGEVVFQPSFLFASGPRVSAFLVGNVSDLSVSVSSVSPSNSTGTLTPASCTAFSPVQWTLSQETIGKSALLVRLSLNQTLLLCGNETDCCTQPLCVREALQVSACRGEAVLASLIVQAEIYAQLPPAGPVSENKTTIPNQVFQPLGRCPCNLTPGECDIRCCCDQDCTPEVIWLFALHCLPGPFGGSVTATPEYDCSAQSAENAPDWFPFLCVTSSSENNPFLGLFYHGNTISSNRASSFQPQQVTAPVPSTNYRQGVPIFTTDNQYFTIPQMSVLGQCLDKSPVAFLLDFEYLCVKTLWSCPTTLAELRVAVRDGQGGVVTVSVVDEVVTDVSSYLSSPIAGQEGPTQLCVNVDLALSYTLYWKENRLTDIIVRRRTGNVTLSPAVSLTTRYSAVFVNGNATAQPNSGNPGYQVGRPVIGGILEPTTGTVSRASVHLWQAVGDGLCSTASLRPVLYGLNSTSGCLMPVSLINLTQCSQLREMVRSTLAPLVPATLVSRTGKPDFSILANWTQITSAVQNSSQPAGSLSGVCSGVPAHMHIYIRSTVMGTVGGVTQKMVQAVELSFKETTWSLECDAIQGNPCVTPDLMQLFPVTSSVTFTDILSNTQPPKSRFRINFTEFDCDRNDVCWPELVFPLTRYYTGEPYTQALAKGLILVFFFIAASMLGTPWRQIRQVWSNTSL